jgi:predicted MFS family arabinose efflux permease
MGLDEKDASYLLSIVGIANTVGRIVLGFLSDKEWVNRLYLYNIALATCGLGNRTLVYNKLALTFVCDVRLQYLIFQVFFILNSFSCLKASA